MADWFYHAPSKVQPRTEPLMLPPTSQIPGLSELPDAPYEEPRKMLLKDTDSAYVRLAKQGGRPDLLRQRTPKERPQQAKGYPKVDWYYQDDIAMEENQNKEPPKDYQFLLPEYMVHKEWSGAGKDAPQPQRVPYAVTNDTSYQSEGRSATDKTQHIEEPKKSGYGVRLQRYSNKTKPPNHLPPMAMNQGRPHGHPGELQQDLPRYNSMPMMEEDNRPMMSKLLSYGYQKDWLEEHDKWETSHPRPAPEEPPPATNSASYGRRRQQNSAQHNSAHRTQGQHNSAQRKQAHNGNVGSAASSTRGDHRRKRSVTEDKPDFFNLSQNGRTGTYYHKTREQSVLPVRGDDLQHYSALAPIPSQGQRACHEQAERPMYDYQIMPAVAN